MFHRPYHIFRQLLVFGLNHRTFIAFLSTRSRSEKLGGKKLFPHSERGRNPVEYKT